MNKKPNLYYLSLGSNMNHPDSRDKTDMIKEAVKFLRELGHVPRVSSLYETEAIGMEPGANDFCNLALSLETSLSPFSLLAEVKEFEARMGRDILHSHNLPRIIDIDILLAGHQIIDSEKLAIPHKEMINRAFVLIPLNEIAPNAIHPGLQLTVKSLLAQLPPAMSIGKVRKLGAHN